jgi:SAM-dependent methyltransferase
MDARKESERAHFDDYYGDGPRKPAILNPLGRFYSLAAGGVRYSAAILDGCAGKDVLEYGCGPGWYSFPLAERGARVTGIDISSTAIARATAQAASRPQLQLRFEVADAEDLPFADASFDRVCGSGILHHLNIAAAARQIRRVLRPGGDAIFIEPVAYNPMGAAFRVLTPKLHTPDEHPLVRGDIDTLRGEFEQVDIEFFSLLAPAAIPALAIESGKYLFHAAEAVDRALLKIPGLRWLGGFAVLSAHAGDRTPDKRSSP